MTKTWDEVVEIAARAAWEQLSAGREWESARALERDERRIEAAAALRALIAEGLAIVPREATEDMQNAAGIVIDHPSVYMGGPSRNGKRRGTQAYEAALSAGEIAPQKDPSP